MLDLYFLQEHFISDKIYIFKRLTFDNYEKLWNIILKDLILQIYMRLKKKGRKNLLLKIVLMKGEYFTLKIKLKIKKIYVKL